jgi:hypothetical protein
VRGEGHLGLLVTSASAYAVYLGFVLWAVAGSVLKLVAYQRGL